MKRNRNNQQERNIQRFFTSVCVCACVCGCRCLSYLWVDAVMFNNASGASTTHSLVCVCTHSPVGGWLSRCSSGPCRGRGASNLVWGLLSSCHGYRAPPHSLLHGTSDLGGRRRARRGWGTGRQRGGVFVFPWQHSVATNSSEQQSFKMLLLNLMKM